MMLKEQKCLHLLTSLFLEMPPSIKRTVTPTILTAELLPLLGEVITPTLRPVSVLNGTTCEQIAPTFQPTRVSTHLHPIGCLKWDYLSRSHPPISALECAKWAHVGCSGTMGVLNETMWAYKWDHGHAK